MTTYADLTETELLQEAYAHLLEVVDALEEYRRRAAGVHACTYVEHALSVAPGLQNLVRHAQRVQPRDVTAGVTPEWDKGECS